MARQGQDERRRQQAQRPRRASGTPAPTPKRAEEVRQVAVVAEDADLRNYIRAPYVPDYGMRVGRFITRGQLAMAEASGWRRFGAAVVCFVLLLYATVALVNIVNTLRTRDGLWGAQFLVLGLIVVTTAPLGIALLRRLLRPPVR